eukprot:302095-Rhodomonas_salina.2
MSGTAVGSMRPVGVSSTEVARLALLGGVWYQPRLACYAGARWAMLLRFVRYRAGLSCYGVFGTEVGYAATRWWSRPLWSA